MLPFSLFYKEIEDKAKFFFLIDLIYVEKNVIMN